MNLASLVAVLAVFTFGMVVAFPGSIKLRLAERLALDDGRVGRLLMVWQIATMAIMLVIGPLLDRFGHRLILIAGFLVVASAIAVFAAAKKPAAAFAGAVALGLGGSCVNAGGNTLLPALNPGNPAAASNLGNVFFGLGAFVVPFFAGFLFERVSFRAALNVFAAASLIAVIPAAAATYPAVASGFDASAAFGLLLNPGVLLAGLLLFCYIGLEVSAASWTTTYLKSSGFSEKRASVIFSMFWVAMMVGRLAAAQWVTTGIGKTVIQTAALAAGLTLLLMTLGVSRSLGAQCTIALGLFFAPLFPTTVGITFTRFSPSLYGSVFAIIFAAGLIGSTVVPAAIGSVSKKKSIRAGYRLMALPAAVLLVFAFWL